VTVPRLARREVHDGVRETLFAYARRVDAGDLDGVLELFSEDAVADYGLGRPRHGRDQLAPLLHGLRASCVATSHHVSNVVVRELAGGVASAQAYVVAWHLLTDGELLVLGRYEDELRPATDGWLITRRRLVVHGGGPDLPPFPRLARGDGGQA
jgi:3-phenylpropionate/cinnamic acid dioxygenase small subunit